MSNADGDKEREERAIDALISSSFKEELCELDDEDIKRFGQLVSPADNSALDQALGPNFVQSLFSGTKAKKDEKKVRGELSTSMNRSEDDKPPTDAAKAEMEKKIREADEERKARKKQDGRGDANDG